MWANPPVMPCSKKRIAKVGDEPAVTKMQQRMDFGPDMTLVDTPGMMWPKIAHDSDGYMLAASHAIGVNAVIEEEVAASRESFWSAIRPC